MIKKGIRNPEHLIEVPVEILADNNALGSDGWPSTAIEQN